jgi:hypothetical protein
MKATSSELLMRNFNEIFIELDPLKRAALLAESYTEDCLWIHPGGRIVGREGINEAGFRRDWLPARGANQSYRDSQTLPGIPLHGNG